MLEDILEELVTSGKYQELLDRARTELEQDPSNEIAKYYHVTAVSRESRAHAIELGNRYLKEMKNKQWKGRLANRIGTYQWRNGNHDLSKTYYDLALVLFQETGDPLDLGNVCNNLGVYHELRGELTTAIEHYKDSIMYKQQVDNPGYGTQLNIAIVYRDSENYPEAINSFNHVIQHYEKTEEWYSVVLASFHLLRTYLMMDDLKQAHYHLEKINKISEIQQENRDINILRNLAEGVYLASTNQLRDMVQAEILLKKVLEEDPNRYGRAILALQYLVKLKILELKLTSEASVIEDIEGMIKQMSDLATKNHAYPTHIEIQILLARFHEVKGEISSALNTLKTTQKFIEMNNLDYLQYKIDHEQERIMSNVDKIHQVLSKNRSMIDRLNQEFIEDYLKSIKL